MNNFERDEGSTRRKKKQRLVKVSQLFLSDTVVFLLLVLNKHEVN